MEAEEREGEEVRSQNGEFSVREREREKVAGKLENVFIPFGAFLIFGHNEKYEASY